MATLIRAVRIGTVKKVPVVIEERKETPYDEVSDVGNGAIQKMNMSSPSQSWLPHADVPPLHSEVEEAVDSTINVEADYEADFLKAIRRAETAEQRLASLELELQSLKEEAVKEGYDFGMKQGKEEGQAQFKDSVDSLASIVASLEAQRNAIWIEGEDNIVEVVYAAIVKILGEELVTAAGVRETVKRVVGQVVNRDTMIIRVAPQDFPLLDVLSNELRAGSGVTALDMIPDDRVEFGGCILETTSGSLDGRLEVQLQGLKETLLAVHARRIAESDLSR